MQLTRPVRTSLLLLFIVNLMSFSARAQESNASVVTAVPVESTTTSAPKLKGNIESLIFGRDIQDKYLQSVGGLTIISPHLDLTYNSWLAFDVGMTGLFVAGNTKSFYTDEGNSTNLVALDEAAAILTPVDGLTLKGGAVQTTINPIQSNMSIYNTFLGAIEKYDWKIGALTLTPILEQSVPSAGTITHGLIDDAPNAFFLTETIQAELKLEQMASSLKLATTHYEFGNLSSNIASSDIMIGNDPRSFEGLGKQTRYIIGFQGMETAAQFTTDWLATLSTDLKLSYIQNYEAPSDRNSGTMASLKMTKKFSGWNLIPTYSVFKMGADTTPAAYTILEDRINNRQGFTLDLKVELPKEKVSFFTTYTHGAVIEANPYMSDRDIYLLGVEAKYDIL